MQKCNQCNSQFKWGEINKSLWLAYRPIQCSECGTQHKIIFSSRVFMSLVSVLPIMIFGMYVAEKYSLSFNSILFGVVALGITVSFINPFIAKYSDDF